MTRQPADKAAQWAGFGDAIRRFGRNEDGVYAVEFAMIALPFFLIIFSIFEIGTQYFVERAMQTGVERTARQIRVGTIRGSAGEADFRQALCDEARNGVLFLFNCDDFRIDVQQIANFTPQDAPPEDDDGNIDDEEFKFEPGGRSSINVVRVFYQFPAMNHWTNFGESKWSGNDRLLEATFMFRNEPY